MWWVGALETLGFARPFPHPPPPPPPREVGSVGVAAMTACEVAALANGPLL